MQSRQKTIFETVVDILYEFGEKETIEKLGGKWNPNTKRSAFGVVSGEEREKHWKEKSTPKKGENPTIETDTGETVRAKPFRVFPAGGQSEQEFAGLPLDAADGTYTNRGEENRAKFKQIVQQPLPPMEYTSTTVSENKFSTQSRLDIIFETVNQILSEGKGDKRGAGRKRNLKKARQRIKSDMKGLARVEDEMSDISGVQDRFWTPERAGREEELEQSYGKIQDRIATAKKRIAKRS